MILTVADPGFPEEGGRQGPTARSRKISMWKQKNLDAGRRGRVRRRPLDPPMIKVLQIKVKNLSKI